MCATIFTLLLLIHRPGYCIIRSAVVLSQFHSQSATRQIKQVSYDTLVTSLFRYQTSWRFCKPSVLQSSHREKAKMEVVMCLSVFNHWHKNSICTVSQITEMAFRAGRPVCVMKLLPVKLFTLALPPWEKMLPLQSVFSKVSEGKWPQKNEKQNKDDNSSRAMQRKPLQMTSTRAICVDIQLILPSTIIGRKSRSDAGVWEISWWFICCCFCSAGRHSSYFRVALNISLQAPPAG